MYTQPVAIDARSVYPSPVTPGYLQSQPVHPPAESVSVRLVGRLDTQIVDLSKAVGSLASLGDQLLGPQPGPDGHGAARAPSPGGRLHLIDERLDTLSSLIAALHEQVQRFSAL